MANLTEKLDMEEISSRAYLSAFYFQRIFNVLCGFTVSEYIRNRRLSLAAEELCGKNVKIIDIAIKYGYDSPDSFTRAFTKFHGITPSEAKHKSAYIKSFAKLRLKFSLEGGEIMEYKILDKKSFTTVGFSRRFRGEDAYVNVPKFWGEHYGEGRGKIIDGMFGICIDSDGSSFDYIIADMYLPWKDIPDGCVTTHFGEGSWAVFPWHGECPKALQDVNTKIWSEWLPNCKEYEPRDNYNLEVYFSPTDGEIWIPVKKK